MIMNHDSFRSENTEVSTRLNFTAWERSGPLDSLGTFNSPRQQRLLAFIIGGRFAQFRLWNRRCQLLVPWNKQNLIDSAHPFCLDKRFGPSPCCPEQNFNLYCSYWIHAQLLWSAQPVSVFQEFQPGSGLGIVLNYSTVSSPPRRRLPLVVKFVEQFPRLLLRREEKKSVSCENM